MEQKANKTSELTVLIGFVLVAALGGYWATGQFAMALALMIGMIPIVMSVATRH